MTVESIGHSGPLRELLLTPGQTIAITATFTVEPLEQALSFWMRELAIPSDIEFAPYNQIFQQLLDPASLLSKNHTGINVVLVRFEDWLRFDVHRNEQESRLPHSREKIERNINDLLRALKAATARSAIPYLICVCPASTEVVADANSLPFLVKMEELMAAELATIPGAYLIRSAELTATYPVAVYYDAHGDKLAHIPFTPPFFTALATMLARKIHALKSSPHKVIVLDCDQTLWKGVCGEDGAQGIEIDAPHKTLQEFIVAQHAMGMLVCLCSKNNEEDVIEVFDSRDDMPLRREHIVAWRINWARKSENLKSLAEELQLGLDSFIFIDDDPATCAEVEESCPEVLTVLLPQDTCEITKFLGHIWAFDRLTVTHEDAARTAFYKQNLQRERTRKEALSFEDFLAGLAITIRISPLQQQHVGRVAQLTQRTNQFNFTTIRRTEADIQTLLHMPNVECLVVEVSDRFGDYGLVGMMVFELAAATLQVDSFLLSCRALGKGVENRMLAALGEIAQSRGLADVEVTYLPTQKNRLAYDFLSAWNMPCRKLASNGTKFIFPAAFAAKISLHPVTQEPANPSAVLNTASSLSTLAPVQAVGKSARLRRICEVLSDPEYVHKIIGLARRRPRPQLKKNFIPPYTRIEKLLADIWESVLGVAPIGLQDNFFELGGHSLLAMQVIWRVRDALQVELSLRGFFEAPTITGMLHNIQALGRLNNLPDPLTDRIQGEI